MLTIFTDTDTDITKKDADYLGLKLISMPYTIDGNTVYPYEDWETFDSHEFYEKLRNGTLPKTSSISEEKYIEYFRPVFEKGDDIFYIHFSRNMSATFDAMDKAVKRLLDEFPKRKFYEVDTEGISALSYSIVKDVVEKLKSGTSPEKVVDWAKDEIKHYALYFFADDLKFFKQSGRVSNLAGTVGTILGIRPIIYVNDEGKMVSIGKEKGRFKAAERLIQYVDDLGTAIKDHRIIIASSDNEGLVNEIKTRLIEKYGEGLKIEFVTVNPTIGAHCGPDAVGICFYADHR